MNWTLLSWVFAAMMVLFVIILLSGAIKAFRVKKKAMGLLLLAMAALVGVATYAIYGEMIIGIFK